MRYWTVTPVKVTVVMCAMVMDGLGERSEKKKTMTKKLLVIIGIPIVMCIFVGTYSFGTPLWFWYLDYSNPVIQYFLSHVGLCMVGMSACLKFMVEQTNKRR